MNYIYYVNMYISILSKQGKNMRFLKVIIKAVIWKEEIEQEGKRK